MRTRVQVYQPKEPNQARIPIELINARQAALNSISVDMRIFGIGHVTANYRNVGLKTHLDVSFKPIPGNLPASLAACRNAMVRHLADYMIQFGLLEIELAPNAEELATIQQSWVQLSQVQAESADGPAPLPPSLANSEGIKLNIESDPTTESVLEPAPAPAATPEVSTDEPSSVN